MVKGDIERDKTHFHAIDLDTFQSGPASSSTLDDAIQDQVCVSFFPQNESTDPPIGEVRPILREVTGT